MRFWIFGLWLGLSWSMPVLADYIVEPVDCANVTTPTAPVYNPPTKSTSGSAVRKKTKTVQIKKKAKKGEVVAEDSPEEKLYKLQMIENSTAIKNKISEIQAKQYAIDTEPYFAELPQLRGEKQDLQDQLRTLEMRRDQLESQKTVRDFSNDLAKPTTPPSASPSVKP